MASSVAVAIELTDDERRTLERWARRDHGARVDARSLIVLRGDPGLTNTETAEHLGISTRERSRTSTTMPAWWARAG